MKKNLVIITALALSMSAAAAVSPVFASGRNQLVSAALSANAQAVDSPTFGHKINFMFTAGDEKIGFTERIKERLAALVTEGKITQTEADEAIALLGQTEGRIDLSSLPEAVREAFMPKIGIEFGSEGRGFHVGGEMMSDEQRAEMETQMKAAITERINALVAEGKITQTEADEAIAAVNSSEGMFCLRDLPENILKEIGRIKVEGEFGGAHRAEFNMQIFGDGSGNQSPDTEIKFESTKSF